MGFFYRERNVSGYSKKEIGRIDLGRNKTPEGLNKTPEGAPKVVYMPNKTRVRQIYAGKM